MKVAVTTLAFCVAALLALGLVMLYSSSMTQVGAHYLMMQLVWCAFGFALCVAATTLDYQLLKKLAWPLFLLALFLLVLVLVPHIGQKNQWRAPLVRFLHGVRFQPSELGKIALIIMLAWYGDRYQRQMQTWKRGILFPGALIALMLGLIFVEPDRGTTILLAAVSGAMLLIAGVRWKYHYSTGFARRGRTGGFHFARPDAHEAHFQLVGSGTAQGRRRLSGVSGHDCAWLRRLDAASVSATAGKNSASCRNTTPILFFPSSAKSSV